MRPVATYGAASWTLNKGIAKRLATYERSFKKDVGRELK
jgi:hypothetical protein